jgi:release factor glutamine methyltransferase
LTKIIFNENLNFSNLRLSIYKILIEKFSKKKSLDLSLKYLLYFYKISLTDFLISKKNITKDDLKKINFHIKKLKNDYPIEYILGFTYFCDLIFFVNKNVLIPRPETEELTYKIINYLFEKKNQKILDVCSGSGCIGISIKKKFPDFDLTLLDISEKALNISKINSEKNQVEINFIQSDILKIEKLDTKYDLIVSNPPYVTFKEKKKMKKNVLNFEPHLAIFVNQKDHIIFYKKIGILAFNSLNENGKVFFEINEKFSKIIELEMQKIGFLKIKVMKDFFGKDRFMILEK